MPKLTAEEWKSYRESRDLVVEEMKEAFRLLQANDASALDVLAAADKKLKQFKALTRTYLRRQKK